MEEINLFIDYTETIEQIMAQGGYDWTNGDITKINFLVSPKMIGQKIEVTAKLFHFAVDINSEDAILKINEFGYRSANVMELLVLGFSYANWQREFPIIAFGGPSDEFIHCAPSVLVGHQWRGVRFACSEKKWHEDCRFLGIKK